jgi:hypothetical protein
LPTSIKVPGGEAKEDFDCAWMAQIMPEAKESTTTRVNDGFVVPMLE